MKDLSSLPILKLRDVEDHGKKICKLKGNFITGQDLENIVTAATYDDGHVITLKFFILQRWKGSELKQKNIAQKFHFYRIAMSQ